MTGAAEIRGTVAGEPSALHAPTPPVDAGHASGTQTTLLPIVGDSIATPLDDTADLPSDPVTSLAQTVSRRAAVMLLREQSLQQDLQIKLDRMRADFNAAQEEHSEQLREMNALRDIAVEQGKKDDEILKKFIAMI